MVSEVIHGVFVSSTYEDLREERAAVQKALLKLRCFPIGMELFGSADAETWDFIKRQIDSADYYVAIIADRYGSLADDGLSFTEKEYDYAKSINKPSLVFLHRDRDSIVRAKTEKCAEKREKLDAFILKVRRYPVSFFQTPDDLATQVIVSFVNERERSSRPGYVRSDTVMDPKKYADLLEERDALQLKVRSLENIAPWAFHRAAEEVTFNYEVIIPGNLRGDRLSPAQVTLQGTRVLTLQKFFAEAADLVLSGSNTVGRLMTAFARRAPEVVPAGQKVRVSSDQILNPLKRLVGSGLLMIESGTGPLNTHLVKLTELGAQQFGLLID